MDFGDTKGLPMDLPCYHGPLSKKDCETLLLKDGVDGNFLIRDSESMPGVLCLCVSSLSKALDGKDDMWLLGCYELSEDIMISVTVALRDLRRGKTGIRQVHPNSHCPSLVPVDISRFKNFVYTYRIFKERHGFYNIQTVEGAPEKIFPDLKELISAFEKPNQGLVVHLVRPIKKTSSRLRWRRSQIKLDNIYENSNSEYVEVLP